MRLKITRKSRNIEPSAEPDGGGRARPGRALTAAPRGLGRAVILALGDVLGIVRELVAWPVRLLIGVAELLGRAVLTVWRAAVLPVIRIVYGVASWALRFGEREVTPARTLTVVALAATVVLGASQFSDYRAVQVGAPQYSGVENIAPAPEVDQKSPRTAHGVSVFAIPVASLFVTVFAATRNWRLARLLL